MLHAVRNTGVYEARGLRFFGAFFAVDGYAEDRIDGLGVGEDGRGVGGVALDDFDAGVLGEGLGAGRVRVAG